jgi:hypothetical protein
MAKNNEADVERQKFYEFDDEQVDLSAFKKEFDDIQEKQNRLGS